MDYDNLHCMRRSALPGPTYDELASPEHGSLRSSATRNSLKIYARAFSREQQWHWLLRETPTTPKKESSPCTLQEKRVHTIPIAFVWSSVN